MVSTRGVKARFVEGERVLCYEPDPSKAKVLYESKVLQVVHNKDGRGRKQLEYRIHFQGWNASWDRCVDEDLVLKDTEDNRHLQRRLMDDAYTKLPVKLKDKKKKRRLSDTIREIVQENERHSKDKTGSETGSQTATTTDDDDGTSLTSDADSIAHSLPASSAGRGSVRRDSIAALPGPDIETVAPTAEPCPAGGELYAREFPLEIPIALKAVLERDHQLIKEKHKLLRLPSPPAALTVLESYVVFFAARYLARTSERRRNETRLRDKAYLTLDLCKEVMDGVRVCFDFHCTTHLLYDEERQQAALLAAAQPPAPLLKEHNRSHAMENGKEDDKNKTTDDRSKGEEATTGGIGGRRLTRSGGGRAGASEPPLTITGVSESGRSTPVTVSSVCSSNSGLPLHPLPAASDTPHRTPSSSSSASQQSLLSSLGRQLSHDLAHWTLLPLPHRLPGTAILLYGPIHLLRLFVKLPEILYRMNLPVEKRKIILKHLQLFLEYLDMHNQEFFSESHYVASNASSSV